jgi:methionyl-tRNA formyltransferase
VRVALIGRSEVLYDSGEQLAAQGHEVVLIITAKEAPEYCRSADDFERLAHQFGCTFIRSAKIGLLEDQIRRLGEIDVGVSFNYPGIIPQQIINLFRLGILNGHAGDLPRYRGNAPLAWAILAREPRVGLCIHRMIGGELDAGDIVARDYHPVTLATTVTDLLQWVAQRTPPLFCEAVQRLGENPGYCLSRQSEIPADALRGYPRRPEDGRIDWSRPASDVVRLVNASAHPFAGAFCSHEGEHFIVWQASVVEDEERFLAVPGQVLLIGSGFVDVATCNGKVRLTHVEKAGEAGPPDLFIRSIRERLS